MKQKRLSNINELKQVLVIEVKSIVGMGTESDPVKQITEYFLPNGTRLARVTECDEPSELHEWTEDTEDTNTLSIDKSPC